MTTPRTPERLRTLADQHREAADDMVLYDRHAEALGHYRKAAELLLEAGDHAVRAEVSIAIARSERALRRIPAAAAALEVAAEAYLAVGIPQEVGRCLALLAQLHEEAGARDAARGAWARAIAVGGDRQDPGVLALAATAHGRLAELALATGHADAAGPHLEAADAAARALGDDATLAATALTRARWHRGRGERDAASTALEEALGLFGALKDLSGMAGALGQLGNLRREEGNLASAAQLFESSLTLAESASDAVAAASALTNLANIAISRDDPGVARARYAEVIDIATACGHTETLLGALVNLGNLEAGVGQQDAARMRYGEALEVAKELGAGRLEVDIGMLLAQLDARDGRLDAAEAAITAVMHRAEAIRYAPGLARLRVNLAGLLHAKGRLAEAATGYAAGVEAFAKLQRPADLVAAAIALAECALAMGALDVAKGAAEKAAAAILDPDARERLDCRLLWARIRHAERPTAETEAALIDVAEAFDKVERPLDALVARLLVLDRAEREVAVRADEDVRGPLSALEAAVLALPPGARLETPTRIERDSILARRRRDSDALAVLEVEARALPAPLLAIRVARRALEVKPDAEHVRRLEAEAEGFGYGAELGRIRRLRPSAA